MWLEFYKDYRVQWRIMPLCYQVVSLVLGIKGEFHWNWLDLLFCQGKCPMKLTFGSITLTEHAYEASSCARIIFLVQKMITSAVEVFCVWNHLLCPVCTFRPRRNTPYHTVSSRVVLSSFMFLCTPGKSDGYKVWSHSFMFAYCNFDR